MKSFGRVLAVLPIAILLLRGTLCGQILVLTHTGTGSGSVGATSFSGAAFTITETVNTANRQLLGGTGFFIDDSTASIAITGVGTFTITSSTRTFINSATLGFSRGGSGGADLYDWSSTDPALTNWNMLTAVSLVSGFANLSQWNLSAVTTTGGTLLFSNGSSAATFSAQFTVPEPSTCAVILGLGVLGFVVVMRRPGSTKIARSRMASPIPALR